MSNNSSEPVFFDRTDLDSRDIPYPVWPNSLPSINEQVFNATVASDVAYHEWPKFLSTKNGRLSNKINVYRTLNTKKMKLCFRY